MLYQYRPQTMQHWMLILIDELRRNSAIVYIADVLGTKAHITPYSELLRRSNPTGKAAARRAVAAVVGMFDAFGFGDAAKQIIGV